MKNAPEISCATCAHFEQIPNDYESKFGVCMLDNPMPECFYKSLKKTDIRYDNLFRVNNSHKCGKECQFWKRPNDERIYATHKRYASAARAPA